MHCRIGIGREYKHLRCVKPIAPRCSGRVEFVGHLANVANIVLCARWHLDRDLEKLSRVHSKGNSTLGFGLHIRLQIEEGFAGQIELCLTVHFA